MKAKTIKSALRTKINDWISSIKDPEVAEMAKKNTIVTGGCIVSMLTGEQVNDYDVYFRTPEAAESLARYYVEEFKKNPPTKHKENGIEVPIFVEVKDGQVKVVVKSAGIVSEGGTSEYQYFEGQPDEVGQAYAEQVMGPVQDNLMQADELPGELIDDAKAPYRPVFISANAITLSHGVQLVIRFIGEPEVIHKFYDFIHCTCYWKSWDGELILPAAALEAIITKELRYVGSKYPLCSIIRIRKFVARGWQINAGQILKMCMQLNDLDLKNLAVLEDQLTGVDAFYFMQIIERLKEKQAAEGSASIDSTYLMTIIDRLF